MSEYLFVCGTLRPALTPSALAPLAQKLRCLGPASVTGRLYDLGEYPGAQLTTNNDELIVGEVLELPEQALFKALDDYEGIDPNDLAGSLFVRRKCQAVLADGRALESWIYVYNRAVTAARLIESGDYALWLRNKMAKSKEHGVQPLGCQIPAA